MTKSAFPPIADSRSKILLLGTMPGEQSLKHQQYYAHKGNHFWKIIFTLFKESFTYDYEVRTNLLNRKGIALWDVLQYCERVGSADNNILNELPNDFNSFFNKHSLIKHVFFTSGKAQNYYIKYVGVNNNLQYSNLPSPSSANTWKTFEEKLNEWKLILNSLK